MSCCVSNNPITKPICFDKTKLVLSNIEGHTGNWPFQSKGKENISMNGQNCLSKLGYIEALKYLAKLHSINVNDKQGLDEEIYGGSSIDEKLNDDYQKLNSKENKEKLNFISKYIPKGEDRVYSHGDFKPDNIVLSEIETANTKKINLSAIDWIDFGLRQRQYDFGSLLFGITNLDILNEFLDLYLKRSDIHLNYKSKFLKEAIAMACIVHINAPLFAKEFEMVDAYIEYTYRMIGEINRIIL